MDHGGEGDVARPAPFVFAKIVHTLSDDPFRSAPQSPHAQLGAHARACSHLLIRHHPEADCLTVPPSRHSQALRAVRRACVFAGIRCTPTSCGSRASAHRAELQSLSARRRHLGCVAAAKTCFKGAQHQHTASKSDGEIYRTYAIRYFYYSRRRSVFDNRHRVL